MNDKLTARRYANPMCVRSSFIIVELPWRLFTILISKLLELTALNENKKEKQFKDEDS